MNAQPAPHPTDQTLRAYGLDKLDNASAGSVSQHLESCPDCRRRVGEVSSDSFLRRLRDAKAGPNSLRPAVSSTDGLSMLEGAAHVPAAVPASTLPPGLADHPDYAILRELGRGGMGVVYLAQNTLMGRMEVLKVVGGHLISRPAILDRFLREIRSAARLQHPNIVIAYSALRLGESLVLTMEYVDGLDLARLVKAKGPLPIANACNYVHQAALGLHHAHEHGMVHRDIKPANMILARAGSRAIVKVLDFGLAKVTSEGQRDAGLTREGQMLGTPDYIAPEQIRDAQSADIRADIYSLGCTLYHLLSGGPPFSGDSLWDVYQAHFSMDAGPLNLLRPEVPVELAALVAKMMAKEPGRRFQEPKEVAQALRPFFKPESGAVVGWKPDDSPRVQPEAKGQSIGPDSPPARDEADPTPARPSATGVSPEVPWTSLIDVGETKETINQVPIALPNRRPRWMIPSVAVGILFVGIVVAFATGTLPFPGRSREFRPFNGRDFQGWKTISDGREGHPSHVFRIQDGELVWTGNDGRIFPELMFGDFSLQFQYRVPLRGRNQRGSSCLLKLSESEYYRIGHAAYRTGEVALLLTDGGMGKAGDIIPFDFVTRNPGGGPEPRSVDATRHEGEWNDVEIRCSGRAIQFRLNDTDVNQVEGDLPIVCYPGFHSWGTDIQIRNIIIKPLNSHFTVQKAPDALQSGTSWTGYLLLDTERGPKRRRPVRFEISRREGTTFEADWYFPYSQHWKILGTVQDGQISWQAKDVRPIKGKEQGCDAVGTLDGEVISMRYSGITDDGIRYSTKFQLSLSK